MPFDLASAQPVQDSSFDLASAKPVGEPVSLGSQLARQAGLTARAGIEGATAIPQVITNAGIGAYNLGARGINALTGANIPPMRSSTAALDDAMTRLGLPEPQGGAEKAANIGTQMLTGGLTSGAEKAALESVIGKDVPRALPPAVQQARAAGYKIPPTQMRESTVNRALEGFSGRDQMARAASVKNQATTNQLAARAIELPENKPITTAAIDERIKSLGQAYQAVRELQTPLNIDGQFVRDVQKISGDWGEVSKEFPNIVKDADIDALKKDLLEAPTLQAPTTARQGTRVGNFRIGPRTPNVRANVSGDAAVTLAQKLRYDASANLKNFASPKARALGTAQRKAADAIDDMVERDLARRGDPRLYRDYVAARRGIAKAYTVRDALDDASGNVSAKYLGQQLAKEKPLSDELRTIAKFANAFPQAAREAQKIGSQPGVSPLDLWASMAEMARGAPAAAAAALVGRPIARSAALSESGQNLLANGIPADTMAALLGTGAPLLNEGQ